MSTSGIVPVPTAPSLHQTPRPANQLYTAARQLTHATQTTPAASNRTGHPHAMPCRASTLLPPIFKSRWSTARSRAHRLALAYTRSQNCGSDSRRESPFFSIFFFFFIPPPSSSSLLNSTRRTSAASPRARGGPSSPTESRAGRASWSPNTQLWSGGCDGLRCGPYISDSLPLVSRPFFIRSLSLPPFPSAFVQPDECSCVPAARSFRRVSCTSARAPADTPLPRCGAKPAAYVCTFAKLQAGRTWAARARRASSCQCSMLARGSAAQSTGVGGGSSAFAPSLWRVQSREAASGTPNLATRRRRRTPSHPPPALVLPTRRTRVVHTAERSGRADGCTNSAPRCTAAPRDILGARRRARTPLSSAPPASSLHVAPTTSLLAYYDRLASVNGDYCAIAVARRAVARCPALHYLPPRRWITPALPRIIGSSSTSQQRGAAPGVS
ncbi:hypothetical protein C8J57DRAFT_1668868 [Mycena rebaudengoi]|nr:hypothetical protein C8J57DRAFT_1668868 [Mycena rebaudengoi]